jgi:signal transduction histidine kinase
MTPDGKKSILVVDDTPENLQLLVKVLGEQGYRVRTAPNGERALASIEKELPDLILLDILMPEMDGFEVCRILKADERFNSIPVIFISALNEVFDKVAAFSIGAVDYITKPFQVEEVLARIQTHLTVETMRQQLQIQNQQLQEQNEDLEAFAYTVAHDLKNPLASQVGFLELLRQDAGQLDARAQDILNTSINAAYRMGNIIDELLLFASVRKEVVQTEPVNMAAAVHQSLSRLTEMIDKYQPEILIPDVWPQAQGYEPWIEEVWTNYLSNAMKYGGQPPRLELGAMPEGNGMIRYWVQDNGAGLDEAARAQLFTEFTRLDTVRAQGHGLGLSIVRRIMDKLGGSVGVESAPGQGSQFYFILPASQ